MELHEVKVRQVTGDPILLHENITDKFDVRYIDMRYVDKPEDDLDDDGNVIDHGPITDAEYWLWGVHVPQIYSPTVTAPADIPAEWYLNEKNVERRMVLGKLIGMERLFDKLGDDVTTLDVKKLGSKDFAKYVNDFQNRTDYAPSWAVCPDTGLVNPVADVYKLVRIKLTDTISCMALWMRNFSEEKWHLEYVADDCRTVEEAMDFRLNGAITGTFVWPDFIC